MNKGPKLEDIFQPEKGNSLHDEIEIKRLFLEGSKIGKNILKKEEQVKEAKLILNEITQDMPIDEMKGKLIKMYRIYERGQSLETKVGYLSRTSNPVTVLGICYNLVATKLESLEGLKSTFNAEVQGY